MLLEQITQVFGVSGRETVAVEFVRELLAPHADEIRIDALGSLIAYKKGTGANRKKLMAAAHIDQIGFSVSGIDSNGFLRVRGIGGNSVVRACSGRVTFENGVRGVIGSEENDWAKNDLTKLFIDIGAKSQEEAMKMVKLGDMASYEGGLTKLANDRYLSHGFDDRIGCYILIEALMNLKESYNDLYFVFTSQEEVGIRGAKSAAQRILPDIGIAFDIGASYDTPGDKLSGLGNAQMGNGASLKMMDAASISDRALNEKLAALCDAQGVKYQYEVSAGGGTDGAAMQAAGTGTRVTTISIPTRYGHSASEMIDMGDVGACIGLLKAASGADFSELFE